MLPPLHDAGVQVWADVASVRHAERAVAEGVDGLILLTAGSGGQTGWLNPFAFVRAVRAFYQGPLVLGGGISDGEALRAAEVLGCNLAYMGTRFIATQESMASPAYQQMLVDCNADDIVLTRAFTGLQANMLRPSIVKAGLDPDNMPQAQSVDVARDTTRSTCVRHRQQRAADEGERGGVGEAVRAAYVDCVGYSASSAS